MNDNVIDIHLYWDGPYKIDDLKKKLDDKDKDYGVYQVYGPHPMYGPSVLLYIGLAEYQTFGQRLSQENWPYNQSPRDLKFYVGRISSDLPLCEKKWSELIVAAEKMLIYAHQPSNNTSNKNTLPYDLEHYHVFNWYSYRNLFPEVSGKRFICEFEGISDNTIMSYKGCPDNNVR